MTKNLLVTGWAGGKRAVLPGDVFNIKNRLKEYDPRLDIKWNNRIKCYGIFYNGKSGTKLVRLVMPDELNQGIVEWIKQGDMHNPSNARDIDKEQEIKEARVKNEILNKIEAGQELAAKALRDSGIKSNQHAITRSKKEKKTK